MKVQLYPYEKTLCVQQKMVVFNTSNEAIKKIYLHDWINAYRDKTTPLAKRFTDNFSRSFHFTSKSKRGFTKINILKVDGKEGTWKNTQKLPDIKEVYLQEVLAPGQSVTIDIDYEVKIPHAKFTRYGEDNANYYLRYWYLIPAVISQDGNQEKNIMSNLDMDDLYADFSHYYISFEIPSAYTLTSDLKTSFKTENDKKIYTLTGYKYPNVTLSVTTKNKFETYKCKDVEIISDLGSKDITHLEKETILNRQLQFLESYFGKYPHSKMMLREVDYQKNPIYGLNQLPDFLNLFEKGFNWDVKILKILSKKYINTIFALNKRIDYGVTDGLPTYITMQYIKTFYPNATFIGRASKWKLLKNYEIAKMNFANRYYYFHNLTSQHHYSQPFTTPLDSLSNFNRKIISKYKSAVYMNMLNKNLADNSLKNIINSFSKKYYQKKTSGKQLLKTIESQTNTDISWLRKDFLEEEKEIDYAFKKVKKRQDSIDVKISTGISTTTPFTVYGIKNDSITYQKKIHPKGKGINIFATLPNYNFDKLAINKNHIVPENNLRNNWKSLKSFVNRPPKFVFIKDIEKSKYHQIFFNPEVKYNYYDGVILGMSFTNKTVSWKNFTYKLFPSYGFKNKKLSGSYFFEYKRFAKSKRIRQYGVGIGGSHYQYAPELNYDTFTPYAYITFNRKDLRYPKHQTILMRYVTIKKEKPKKIKENFIPPKVYEYGIFNVKYNYFDPGILKELKFTSELQVASNFSKISVSSRYKKLTNQNKQITLRFFGGMFLHNNDKTDFFSFGLERPTDYLFQYDYLGRSETQGILSQQIVISEGGFTSKLPVPFANRWMVTTNASVNIWRWFEVYGNVGLVKNKGMQTYFAYESGFKFSFIPDMLELYFPMYSNLGWEVGQPKYPSKIRFVIGADLNSIYNFVRRGFY